MKKKRRSLSLAWGLIATAGIFFIFGQFIVPPYEAKLIQAGIYEEKSAVSTIFVSTSAVLAVLFIIVLVRKFTKTKSEV